MGQISNSVSYRGKLTLQKGQYLQIPSGIREKLNIKAGDSLAIHLEGNEIIIKPVAELSTDRSVHNIVLFPLLDRLPEPHVKFPVHKVSGEKEIDKVG